LAFYQHILSSLAPWHVSHVECFDNEVRVDIGLEHVPAKFHCEHCMTGCAVYDHVCAGIATKANLEWQSCSIAASSTCCRINSSAPLKISMSHWKYSTKIFGWMILGNMNVIMIL
jgi:hypothetical protein